MSKVMEFIIRSRNILLALALVVFLGSCMDDDDSPVTEPVEVAYVSFYHASPDAPALDIVVDGRVINRNPFDYASYSGYLNFFTGNRDFRFNSANADNALVDTTFNFENGRAYSLFAINEVENVKALLVEDSAAAPSAGKAMVRFVHLSPDAPEFELSTGRNPEETWFGPTSYKEASGFREVAADTYTFQVRNAGEKDARLAAENVSILSGRYYTIITRGFASPPEGNMNALSIEVLD